MQWNSVNKKSYLTKVGREWHLHQVSKSNFVLDLLTFASRFLRHTCHDMCLPSLVYIRQTVPEVSHRLFTIHFAAIDSRWNRPSIYASNSAAWTLRRRSVDSPRGPASLPRLRPRFGGDRRALHLAVADVRRVGCGRKEWQTENQRGMRQRMTYFSLVWPWLLTSWPAKPTISCPCPADHLHQFASKSVNLFSKYPAHKFGNKQTDC